MQPRLIVSMKQWWNHKWPDKTDVLGGKPTVVLLCSPHVSHEINGDGTRASELRSQRPFSPYVILGR
jgi:hypothetical protein